MSELVFQLFSAAASPRAADQGIPRPQPDLSNQQAPANADISDHAEGPTTQNEAQQQGPLQPSPDTTTTPPFNNKSATILPKKRS